MAFTYIKVKSAKDLFTSGGLGLVSSGLGLVHLVLVLVLRILVLFTSLGMADEGRLRLWTRRIMHDSKPEWTRCKPWVNAGLIET